MQKKEILYEILKKLKIKDVAGYFGDLYFIIESSTDSMECSERFLGYLGSIEEYKKKNLMTYKCLLSVVSILDKSLLYVKKEG
jgi:hypothetical protein